MSDSGTADLEERWRSGGSAATAILTGNLDEYGHVRDTLSMPLPDHVDRLAWPEWTPEEAAGSLVTVGSAMADGSDAFPRHLAAAGTELQR